MTEAFYNAVKRHVERLKADCEPRPVYSSRKKAETQRNFRYDWNAQVYRCRYCGKWHVKNMYIDPNRDDLREPARIAYGVRDPAELAFVLFHEGFRCGYNVLNDNPRPNPPDMEVYIKAMFLMVTKEIREQQPGFPQSR